MFGSYALAGLAVDWKVKYGRLHYALRQDVRAK